MTNISSSTPSRRTALTWSVAVALTGLAGPALTKEWPDLDPFDRVPSYYGVERFTRLSENQVYKVHLAVKNGRYIQIGRYPNSVSRQIIRDGARDWPATRQKLLDDGY